jgi:hypothetical protein
MPPGHIGSLLHRLRESKAPKSKIGDNVPEGGSIPRVPYLSEKGDSDVRPNITLSRPGGVVTSYSYTTNFLQLKKKNLRSKKQHIIFFPVVLCTRHKSS